MAQNRGGPTSRGFDLAPLITHFTKTNYATTDTPYHESLAASYIPMPKNVFASVTYALTQRTHTVRAN